MKKTESLRVLSPKKSLTFYSQRLQRKCGRTKTSRGVPLVDRPTGKGRGGNSKEVSKGLNLEPARQLPTLPREGRSTVMMSESAMDDGFSASSE